MRPTVDEPAKAPPARLWERLRADPLRAPEHIALGASEYHGPAAAAWADRRRRVYGTDGKTLAQMARRRHASLASVEGAATGVGGIVTMVPDLVGLAWIESRMVFFIAAAYGFDPLDPHAPGRAAGPERALRAPGRRAHGARRRGRQRRRGLRRHEALDATRRGSPGSR